MTENTIYDEDFNEVEAPKKSGSGKTAALVALGTLLTGSLAYNGYQVYKNGFSGQSSDAKANKEAVAFFSRKDSIAAQIKALQDSLAMFMPFQKENERLQGQLEDAEKRAAAGGANASVQRPMGPPIPMNDEERTKFQARERELLGKLAALQQKYDALDKVKVTSGGKVNSKALEEANNKIAALEKELTEAKEARDQYSMQVADERAKYDSYAKENAALKDKISRGGKPQFGTLQTVGIYYKGGQPMETFKAKTIEKLKITFDILENPLIDKPVEEEVTIRIVGPEGNVLTTNTTKLTDKASLYSIKQTIMTEGEMGKTKWFYPTNGKMEELKKGKYTTELYAEGVLKQRNTFTLE